MDEHWCRLMGGIACGLEIRKTNEPVTVPGYEDPAHPTVYRYKIPAIGYTSWRTAHSIGQVIENCPFWDGNTAHYSRIKNQVYLHQDFVSRQSEVLRDDMVGVHYCARVSFKVNNRLLYTEYVDPAEGIAIARALHKAIPYIHRERYTRVMEFVNEDVERVAQMIESAKIYLSEE